MSRWADRAAREMKAAELEQIIVAAGQHEAYLAGGCTDPAVRKAALAALSAQRGTRVTASEDTWSTVRAYLTDRFRRAA